MSFLENGFQLIENVLNSNELKDIRTALSGVELNEQSGGIRNAEKKFPKIAELAHSTKLINLAKKYVIGQPKLVRVILFDKTAKNNWLVSWHQDRTVSVSEKFNDESWGPWSLKEGIHHVQPPEKVLNKMVTFRVHLDDADENNGCLKVIPKSHQLGLMAHEDIQAYIKAIVCTAKAGTVLAMRPHLLHSSSKALMPSSRRVIHIEFSSYELPSGVYWN